MTVNYHIIALIHIFILYLLRLYLPHNAKIYSRIYFGTPPGRTPNGGGYPFSKFFLFFIFLFFRHASFRSHFIREWLLFGSTRFKPF